MIRMEWLKQQERKNGRTEASATDSALSGGMLFLAPRPARLIIDDVSAEVRGVRKMMVS